MRAIWYYSGVVPRDFYGYLRATVDWSRGFVACVVLLEAMRDQIDCLVLLTIYVKKFCIFCQILCDQAACLQQLILTNPPTLRSRVHGVWVWSFPRLISVSLLPPGCISPSSRLWMHHGTSGWAREGTVDKEEYHARTPPPLPPGRSPCPLAPLGCPMSL